jgi:hypothetical protein
MHFRGPPKFGKPCSTSGIQSFASAPDCFNPDVTVLARADVNMLHQLGLLIKDLTQPQLRILTYTFKAAAQLKKAGLKFGQPVWFSAGPSNYLSNFYKGYVVGCSSSGEHIHLISDKESKRYTTCCSLLRDSVLTKSEFQKVKADLVAVGHLVDPQAKQRSEKIKRIRQAAKSAAELEAYQPPTLDEAPKEWLSLHNQKAKSTKKSFRTKPVDQHLKEVGGDFTFTVKRHTKKA